MTAQLPSRERLAEIHKLAAKSDKYIYHLRADEVEAMARFALAAHEQEPDFTVYRLVEKSTGEVSNWRLGDATRQSTEGDAFQVEVLPLYTHPAPVPAVPDEMEDNGNPHDEEDMAYVGGWNACRDAMLSGGKSTHDEWRSSLQELVKAMRDYEMDVDEPAPYKHREMMRRAEALLNGGKS